MSPLLLRDFTATSCIGRGLAETVASLRAQRSGLAPCAFETVRLDTYVGEVPGVDEEILPATLSRFDCRNNRLAQLGLRQDGFREAVRESARRWGARRIGLILGTSTSGMLATELAYRRRDPATGALPHDFDYGATQNSFSLADFAQHLLAGEIVARANGDYRLVFAIPFVVDLAMLALIVCCFRPDRGAPAIGRDDKPLRKRPMRRPFLRQRSAV